MHELKLQLDGTHEGDCKKPGESHSIEVKETNRYCFINEYVIGKVLSAFNHLLGLK